MGYTATLQAQYDSHTNLIEGILQRAAAEDREVTDDEKAQIDAAEMQRTALDKSIEHYAAIEERTSKAAERRSRIPAGRKSLAPDQPPTDVNAELLRMFPTPGHYAAAYHAATARGDKGAGQDIERAHELMRVAATAHQKTTDNPGIIPNPIVGPVVDRLKNMRPFVASLGGAKAAPTNKFDRPKITQNVDVDVQAAEKDLTASQVMKVDPVAVALKTYAGHLNISKQDIRWSQPSILTLIYDSFVKIYARKTDKAACAAFGAGITATQSIEEATAAGFDAALGAAGATVETADGDMGELNHIWLSRDVAVTLGSLRNPTTGTKLYNIPIVGGTSGDMDGIPVTIDPRFAAGTFIAGDDSLVEFWEDIEGLMMVEEPNVLGQMVGYAGYADLPILDKSGFVKLTMPAPEPPSGG